MHTGAVERKRAWLAGAGFRFGKYRVVEVTVKGLLFGLVLFQGMAFCGMRGRARKSPPAQIPQWIQIKKWMTSCKNFR